MKINYPQHIVDHAFQKARSLSRDVALRETAKSDAKIIPYVITYNPSLPRIDDIINKYWGLLALSQKSSVNYIFQHKPVLAFRRPQNLADILTHSKINISKYPTGSVSSCKRRRYTHCKSTNESTEFVCSNTNEAFLLKYAFDCISENVIYLTTCKNVMHNMLDRRAKRFQREWTVIVVIFVIIQIISQMFLYISMKMAILQGTFHLPLLIKLRLNGLDLKETYWMHRLNTIHPNRMDSKVLYQIP